MDEIDTLLTRGVDNIYPSKETLEKLLRGGKKLRLYQGFDPTGTRLHIGHMVGFRKLAQFARAGHTVIFLIGDGTGQAGDPSGKTRARSRFFNSKQLRQNAKNYVLQAKNLIDFSADNVEIRYNGDWLNELNLAALLDIAGHFTLQQMLERDLYQQRLRNRQDLSLREFFYPLLQGYDSVAMDVDLELGGTDQTFNMLAGRKLVKAYLGKEKFVMTTPLLADSTGVKIGKSEGNVIGLTDAPNDLYGKIMALSDTIIVTGFEYLTDVPTDELKKMEKQMEQGANPIAFKKQLAKRIVTQLHSETEADQAQKFFETTFQKQTVAADQIPVITVQTGDDVAVSDLLIHAKLAPSKSQARQLLDQGAISVNGQKVAAQRIHITDGDVLRVGKSRFAKLRTR